MANQPIPAGYWQDASGSLIPESKIKDIDKLRHQVVTDLCVMAEKSRDGLADFKARAMQEVAALVSTSMEQYGVKAGGEKGNVTLISFDGVDYEASSAQKRWAGKYGTLAEALGKVAEYSKYDEAGQIQAADIVERAKRDKELRERQRSSGNSTASTSPALVAGASGANGSTTYVSHITLPNGSKTTVKFADAASQSATEQLLRDLVTGKGVVQ